MGRQKSTFHKSQSLIFAMADMKEVEMKKNPKFLQCLTLIMLLTFPVIMVQLFAWCLLESDPDRGQAIKSDQMQFP